MPKQQIDKIKFEDNGYIFKSISFNKSTNTLIANKFDKKENFIKKVEIKMGQIPKSVKKKLNPLK
ncbi:MAG: hypothetical protein U9N59_13750 [Campylobacterota bacterium]|nr:hypothetical protein [Campylobacterota bacterium]